MTEESPFYVMVYWYTGRYGKNVERKMTVFFDKINKSILFVPKMKMDTTLAIDGEKISVVGNNPWMGDYKLSRQGEFEEVSGSVYKIKWTGHGETTKGFLRRVSPVETNVVASVNVRN